MGSTRDPLRGWAFEEYLKQDCGGADNDIYGKFFYYVRDQFERFIERVHTLNLHFEIAACPVQDLASKIGDVKFDRIFVSTAPIHRRHTLCSKLMGCRLQI
jgi:hypothetical protein